MRAKEFIIELKKESKPRNFVAKNASLAGKAGQHKDKKKAEKQGDVKHKNKNMDVEEGFRSKLAGLGLAGAMALGAGNAQAADLSYYDTQYLQKVANGEQPKPKVSVDDARAELQARANGKQQKVTPEPSNSKSGYNKEYLQKAANPDRTGIFMISVEKAQDLLKQMDSKVGEGSMFAGAKVGHKEGPAGQWRNDNAKKNKPARPGDLVGGGM